MLCKKKVLQAEHFVAHTRRLYSYSNRGDVESTENVMSCHVILRGNASNAIKATDQPGIASQGFFRLLLVVNEGLSH